MIYFIANYVSKQTCQENVIKYRMMSSETSLDHTTIQIDSITDEEHASRPGTSLESGGEDQQNLSSVLPNTENILESLENLSQQLKKEQEDLLKQFSTTPIQIAVSKHEIGVGSNHVLSEIPEEPPPPYSFHGNAEQRVYIQHGIRYRDPAPNYFETYDDDFQSARLRSRFVAKVYGILTSQFFITFGFVMMCVYIVPVKNFVKTRPVLYTLSTVGLVVLLILLACFIHLRRSFPINFILLLIFTIAFAYSMGTAASFYSEKAVMVATGSTALIVAIVTFLAWLNLFDVTSWGFILYVGVALVLLFGLVGSIIFWVFGGSEMFKMIFASVIVTFFTIYLLYDTQKLIGGGRIALSPEEYILGALSLYVDIMLIFNYVLLLCGRG
ncbi:protein lifeguard 2-like [Diorhabda carinulata]|uniref:protein lifeguard 2-like n=1 Tax=Diorhabda carinulata TaxID=1163345 RepID=UPI0025A0BC4D|nr:protein lifeguard 2-like [Diorhabda carinulata]